MECTTLVYYYHHVVSLIYYDDRQDDFQMFLAMTQRRKHILYSKPGHTCIIIAVTKVLQKNTALQCVKLSDVF